VLGVSLAIRPLGVGFLDSARIFENDFGETPCRDSRVDGILESLNADGGQIDDVVQVSVGDDHRVDGPRINRKPCPVAKSQLLLSLEHPAVDQHPGSLGLNEEAAPRDGTGRTEKVNG